jgi:hypothetical protein
MNSEGEKIPPYRSGAKLGDKQQCKQRRHTKAACQDRLNRRVANTFDVIVSRRPQQHVDQDAEHQHTNGIAKIRIFDALE